MAKTIKTSKRPSPARQKPKSRAATPSSVKSGKYVYYFGDGRADGDGKMKGLLGGKGANLAEMTRNRSSSASRVHHFNRGLHLFLRT